MGIDWPIKLQDGPLHNQDELINMLEQGEADQINCVIKMKPYLVKIISVLMLIKATKSH